jgi:hypothetical protein
MRPQPDKLAAPTELHVVIVDEDHCVGTATNLIVVAWRRQTTARAMDSVRRSALDLYSRNPKGICVMQIVCVGAKPPDSRAREAITRFLQAGETAIKHSSLVHEGMGFVAASIRAFMAGIYLVNRPQFAHKLFDSVEGAARWHAEQQQGLGLDDPRRIEKLAREVERIASTKDSAARDRTS